MLKTRLVNLGTRWWADALDRLGDWNPQLLRELRGRLSARTVLSTLALSILIQVITASLILPIPTHLQKGDLYCAEHVQYAEIYAAYQNTSNINEPAPYPSVIQEPCQPAARRFGQWIQDRRPTLFYALALIETMGGLAIGCYMLVHDLTQEERQKTLDFLRLSPEPASRLFLGKLLGVPVLLYLGLAAAVPLQLWAALGGVPSWSNSQIGWAGAIAFGFAFVASCGVFYSLSLLLGLLGAHSNTQIAALGSGFQSVGWASAVGLLTLTGLAPEILAESQQQILLRWGYLFLPHSVLTYPFGYAQPDQYGWVAGMRTLPEYPLNSTQAASGAVDWLANNVFTQGYWLGVPVGAHLSWFLVLMGLNAAAWIGWIWVALDRKFRIPHAPLLSKPQSYGVSGTIALTLIGYCITPQALSLSNVVMFTMVGGLMAIALMALLLPQWQPLADWARYRHLARSPRRPVSPSILGNLRTRFNAHLTEDNAPLGSAMGLNLAILMLPTLVIFLDTIIDRQDWEDGTRLALIGLFYLTLWLYGAIVQWISTFRLRRQTAWLAGTGLVLSLTPLFGAWATESSILLLLSPLSLPVLIHDYLGTIALDDVIPVLMFQSVLLVGVMLLTRRAIGILGASETRELMLGQRLGRSSLVR